MDRELWLALYRLAMLLGSKCGGWLYSAADIVTVFLWAVVHDRPMIWALDRGNWPEDLCPSRLPSQATLSKRMRDEESVQLMLDMADFLQGLIGGDQCLIRVIDGKPLTVSGVSKDPDAGYGRGAGHMCKGYKFYAVWSNGPLPLAWGLAAMNCSEKTMAKELIPTLPGEGYLLADSEYDANNLHDLAGQAGFQLIARKRQAKKGVGHRKQSPYRLRSIALLQTEFGKHLNHERKEIERSFGNLVSFGGGLACLPAWVRRMTRVRNWLQGKLLINAIRWCRTHAHAVLALE